MQIQIVRPTSEPKGSVGASFSGRGSRRSLWEHAAVLKFKIPLVAVPSLKRQAIFQSSRTLTVIVTLT